MILVTGATGGIGTAVCLALAEHGVRIVIVELPLVATAMSAPYGSAPRGALTPLRAARRVLRGLETRRTLLSPPWAHLGAVLSQAAPAPAAAGAGGAGRMLRRFTAREARRTSRSAS